MDAIETLMTEHRLIERALDALVAYAEEVTRREAEEADKKELGRFVTFLREFADACHHGKEEGVLFAEMIQAGFPREGGPIAVMLAEHENGRALIRRLAALAEKPERWSASDRGEIAEAARGYAQLLRMHIHKEDAILYPMAEQHLSPEAMERVGERCEAFEAEVSGAGAHERLHALADELVAAHAPALHGGAEGHHAHAGHGPSASGH